MKFYHGTDNGNLKELTTKHSLYEDKVFVSSNKDISIWYCVHTVWYLYGWDAEQKIPKIKEYCPDMLKKMYGGKKGYIYTCENKDFKNYQTDVPNAFCINENVKLVEKEEISDICEYIENRAKAGKIKITHYGDLTNEEKEKCSKQITNWFALANLTKDQEIYLRQFFEKEYQTAKKEKQLDV